MPIYTYINILDGIGPDNYTHLFGFGDRLVNLSLGSIDNTNVSTVGGKPQYSKKIH